VTGERFYTGVDWVPGRPLYLFNPAPAESSQPCRMVVVIDYHVAHLYQDLNQKVPESEHTVHPYDPFDFHHHLIHKKEAHYKGDRVPEDTPSTKK